jgi:hypothetical protein
MEGQSLLRLRCRVRHARGEQRQPFPTGSGYTPTEDGAPTRKTIEKYTTMSSKSSYN